MMLMLSAKPSVGSPPLRPGSWERKAVQHHRLRRGTSRLHPLVSCVGVGAGDSSLFDHLLGDIQDGAGAEAARVCRGGATRRPSGISIPTLHRHPVTCLRCVTSISRLEQ